MRNALFAVVAASALVSLPAAATGTLPTTLATFSGYSVNLVGSALMQGTDLQLTNNTGYLANAAWLTSALSTSQSFSATFNFSLAKYGTSDMADGIAFVLQNQGTNVAGGAGGDIGYSGLRGVGSIIQTWNNNNVGLNTNGGAYSVKDAPTNLGAATLVTGNETVSYNASTHVFSMTGALNVDGATYQIADSATIDLAAKFGPTMYVGFTGGTGGAVADQRITSFSVSAVPEPETYAMLMAGLGLMGVVARRRKAV